MNSVGRGVGRGGEGGAINFYKGSEEKPIGGCVGELYLQ